MTIVLGIGYIVELALIIYLLKVVHRHEIDIFNREFKIEALQRKIDGYNKSVEVLSTSIRKLNDVVKDLEQKQPKVEPKNRMNTRAFIAGWDANDPEDYELLEKERATEILYESARQAFNDYAKDVANEVHIKLCQQTLLYNNYPTLLCQEQQCIYPWQPWPSGQLQQSAMLPLWYINRRLEDM